MQMGDSLKRMVVLSKTMIDRAIHKDPKAAPPIRGGFRA